MLRAVAASLSFMTRGERVKYVALLAGRTISGLLDIVGLALVGVIASLGASSLASGGKSAPVTVMGITLPKLTTTSLIWLVAVLLVVFVGKAALAVFLSWVMSRLVARAEARNGKTIVDFLLHGSLEEAQQFSKAEFQYAITTATSAAYGGLLNSFATIVSEGFLLAIVVIAFVLVDPVAALFAFLYFALIAIVIQFFIGRTLKRAGQDATEGSIGATSLVSDTLDTFRELSVMSKQDLYLRRLDTSRTQLANSAGTFAFMGGMPRYVVETALIIGVVALVGQQWLAGDLVSGFVTVGVFLAGGTRIMSSLLPLQNSLAQSRMQREQADLAYFFLRAHHFRAPRAEAPAGTDVVALESSALDLKIDAASFQYGTSENRALDGVSLSARPGEFIAIIGPSGAGKTTLVDLLLGLIEPTEGTVAIDSLTPLELRAAAPGVVSYVPQRPGLVSGTIAENIALGVDAPDIDRERLAEVIDAAYLAEFIESLPEGTNTSVGKQANALSGGQIQRIGLARALYTQPRLLIMDEATSALDAGSESYISESLKRLHGDVTLLVIAHRLSTVQHADNVYVLEGGKVKASGDFPTLIATVPMVAEYVKLMSFDDA